MPRKKTRPPPAPASESPALDYAAWKKAARQILKQQHGIEAPTVRERDWRNVFITGAPPDAGAEMAYRNHYNAARMTERRKR